MKVVAVNGSPRKNGNTYSALNYLEKIFNKNGIEFEIIHVGNSLIHGCTGCLTCRKTKDETCVFKEDLVNDAIQIMKDADGLILGSPVYFSDIPGTMKSFLDRAFYVSTANNNFFRHKVGASIAAVRRSGGIPTYDNLNKYLLYSEMLVVGANYWNVIHGRLPGEVLLDEEGLQMLETLGNNMVWTLKMVNESKISKPKHVKKHYFSFIRD